MQYIKNEWIKMWSQKNAWMMLVILLGLITLFTGVNKYYDVDASTKEARQAANEKWLNDYKETLQEPNLSEEDGIKYYRTNGTPVDCVKLGQKVVLRDRKIDLVLSGINHGSNSSISLIYSGTMAAAIEASLENVKGVGFSLLDYSSDADFTASIHYAKKLIPQILKTEFPPQVSLNINIPKLPLEEIKGIKIVRQTKGYWNEDLEKRVDCFGRDYYWLSGYLVDQDPHTDTCQWALNNGYVSIQPVQVDMTAYHFINDLKFMEE